MPTPTPTPTTTTFEMPLEFADSTLCHWCMHSFDWVGFSPHREALLYCTPECAIAHDNYCNDGRRAPAIGAALRLAGFPRALLRRAAPPRQALDSFGGALSIAEFRDSAWPASATASATASRDASAQAQAARLIITSTAKHAGVHDTH